MRFATAIAIASALLGACAVNLPEERAAARPRPPLDESRLVPGRTHTGFSFRELDVNNDGVLQRSETAFVPGLAGRGELSRSEFEQAGAGASGNMAGPIAPRFERIDKNGDGQMSALEAAADTQTWAGFESADTDEDGKVSGAEYRARFRN